MAGDEGDPSRVNDIVLWRVELVVIELLQDKEATQTCKFGRKYLANNLQVVP
jgi:hypothetical protein